MFYKIPSKFMKKTFKIKQITKSSKLMPYFPSIKYRTHFVFIRKNSPTLSFFPFIYLPQRYYISPEETNEFGGRHKNTDIPQQNYEIVKFFLFVLYFKHIDLT